MEVTDMGEFMRARDQEDRYNKLAKEYLRVEGELRATRHALACAMDLAKFYRSQARKNDDA